MIGHDYRACYLIRIEVSVKVLLYRPRILTIIVANVFKTQQLLVHTIS